MKNMPKTRTSAQRYNRRIDKIWDKAIKAKDKARNERDIMEAFIIEFQPLYDEKEIKNLTYDELVFIIKDIARLL